MGHAARTTRAETHLRGDLSQHQRFRNLFRRGTEALHQGEIAKAMRSLERAHRLEPEHVDAALNLAAAYILSKRFSKAAEILEPLTRRAADNPMVWTNLGAAYLGNPVTATDQDQRRAIGAFQRAYELNPATPHVAYNLGLIHRDRGEKEAALHWLRRAVQANPADRDARALIRRLAPEEGS
jgi:tetratricopeptide (TPR) repeat protein